MESELDPLAELRFLTEALLAHAEQQRAAGATGLPPSSVVDSTEVHALHATPEPAASPVQPRRPAQALPAAQQAPPAPTPGVSVEPASAEARVARLHVLAGEVAACRRCALHAARTQTVFSRGNGSSGLCFVGEGPGADEDQQGLPFVGAAGQLLDKMIAAMGIDREDVYVCNIVKCRPPENRAPEPEELAACMPYLSEQLGLIEPQVIVALGKTAVQGLFGSVESITKIRGRWRLYQGRIAVMPTFHPAYLLRSPGAKRDVWNDLQAVLKQLGRTPPARP